MEQKFKKKQYLKALCFPFCLLLLICLSTFVYLSQLNLNSMKPISATPVSSPDMIVYQQSGFKVFGQETETNLDIFNVSDFNDEKLLYPNSEGVYTFTVQNNSHANNLAYSLKIEAKNPHNIPITISLEKNHKHIHDMSILTKVNFNDNLLKEKGNDVYTLRWMWEDKDNNKDTILGNNESKFYTMIITAIGAIDETTVFPPILSFSDLFPPKTGDMATALSIVITIFILIFLILLLFKRRKKENGKKE